jgi:formylglycine-generating enzyme required for sulfatase activity
VADALNKLAEVLRSRGKLAEAETLNREALAMQRQLFDAENLAVADTLAALASTLLAEKRFEDAEAFARQCLRSREKSRLDDWRVFDTRSLLGGCILAQTNYAKAEPLLVSGFQGMKQREEGTPANSKVRLKEAFERLVQLYENTGRPERVAELRRELRTFQSLEAQRQQAACAQQLGVPVKYTNAIGMTFCLIPDGEFYMGSAEDDVKALERGDWFFSAWAIERMKSESPRHRVRIARPFWFESHEVTVAQFRRFVTASGYRTEAERDAQGGFGFTNGNWLQATEFGWANPGYPQTDDHPVGNVAWADAEAFCRWLGTVENRTCRLPTEAEWEFACRGGTRSLFYSGDDDESLRGVAHIADAALHVVAPHIQWSRAWNDGYPFAAPVGLFKPNTFGLHDMHGNVWEWCRDVYDPGYYQESPIIDPLCRGRHPFHVFRGGGWDNYPGFCRSADRYSSHSQTLRTEWAGFRVVLEFTDTSALRTINERDGTKAISSEAGTGRIMKHNRIKRVTALLARPDGATELAAALPSSK